MKKMEYKAPELEIIKLKNHISLLSESMGGGSADDDTNPSNPIDI